MSKTNEVRIAGRMLARELNKEEIRKISGGDDGISSNGNTNPTWCEGPTNCAEDDCGRD